MSMRSLEQQGLEWVKLLPLIVENYSALGFKLHSNKFHYVA